MEKKFSFKMFRRIFPFVILTMLILLCAYVGYFRSGYIQDMKEVEETNTNISELEWDYIETVLYEDYLAAGEQSHSVAEDIARKIKIAYPDLDVLRAEMNNPFLSPQPKYLVIMKETIRDMYLHNIQDDDNDMFVCDKNGILMDLSLSTASDSYPNNWDSFYERNVNPELAKEAVNMIFTQSSNMIFWVSYPFMDNDDDANLPHVSSVPSIKEVHRLYMENGIESLKYIQFLAPAYITATGDIFGVDDIDFRGIKTNNHKIVVVQTFNLYEQLMSRHARELERFNVFREKTVSERKIALVEHALYIIIVVILIIVLSYFMMLFNNVVFHGKERKLEERNKI